MTGLLAGITGRGMDVRPFLEGAAVPAEILRDTQLRIPVADYEALYNLVAREIDDEGFALFSAPLRGGTFEFLCRAVLSSATLGEAFDRAGRFLKLVLPDLRVTLERDRDAARLVIAERRRLRPRADDPARVFAFEWLLRLLHALACWLAARPLPLDAVAFPYPAPVHGPDYALIYTEHASFDAPALVARMDATLLALPVRRDDRDLAAFLVDAPGRIALLYRRDREIARAVRELLSADFGATLGQTAVRLRLSERTLHRRLHDEGTSFREIKDGLRRDLALARIRRTTDRVADIAADLGYAEPSAFFRAFHSWTGESPTVHRRRHGIN